MNPEEQRIAIAEACGWIQPHRANGGEFHGLCPNESHLPQELRHFRKVPDYLNDLNAMHEAEIMFADQYDGKFIFEFRCALHTVLGHDGTMDVHADAAQRAEAFLKAKNLWKR